MEIQGKWQKDEEGYMDFETSQLQRLYEIITDQYYRIYNGYAEVLDEEQASLKTVDDGYRLITDYKTINGREEFATSYTTPVYDLDMWYALNEVTGKRDYNKGYLRIIYKNKP